MMRGPAIGAVSSEIRLSSRFVSLHTAVAPIIAAANLRADLVSARFLFFATDACSRDPDLCVGVDQKYMFAYLMCMAQAIAIITISITPSGAAS